MKQNRHWTTFCRGQIGPKYLTIRYITFLTYVVYCSPYVPFYYTFSSLSENIRILADPDPKYCYKIGQYKPAHFQEATQLWHQAFQKRQVQHCTSVIMRITTAVIYYYQLECLGHEPLLKILYLRCLATSKGQVQLQKLLCPLHERKVSTASLETLEMTNLVRKHGLGQGGVGVALSPRGGQPPMCRNKAKINKVS